MALPEKGKERRPALHKTGERRRLEPPKKGEDEKASALGERRRQALQPEGIEGKDSSM